MVLLMLVVLIFVSMILSITFGHLLKKDIETLNSNSYYAVEKAFKHSEEEEERMSFFKKNILESRGYFLPFFKKIFLKYDEDIEREFKNVSPMVEAKLLSSEILEKDFEEKVKFEIEKRMLYLLTKIKNKQFYDQPNLVSKDQVEETIFEEIKDLKNI